MELKVGSSLQPMTAKSTMTGPQKTGSKSATSSVSVYIYSVMVSEPPFKLARFTFSYCFVKVLSTRRIRC